MITLTGDFAIASHAFSVYSLGFIGFSIPEEDMWRRGTLVTLLEMGLLRAEVNIARGL